MRRNTRYTYVITALSKYPTTLRACDGGRTFFVILTRSPFRIIIRTWHTTVVRYLP